MLHLTLTLNLTLNSPTMSNHNLDVTQIFGMLDRDFIDRQLGVLLLLLKLWFEKKKKRDFWCNDLWNE